MANSVDKARENAAFHYDVPTGFFANFLDETYTYSSAMFDKDGDDTLADAQRRKIQTTLDRTGLRHGQSMLEIGCGWGTLSLEAARRGLDVVAISLARRQIDFARNRALAAGSSADFRVADYRSIDGTYDAAVSIEMIEAVGGEHIDEFFSAVSAALVPGGTFVLQFIYTSHARMVLSGRHDTWIRRNIFPGGQILSKELISSAAELAQFHVESSDEIGTDYARTLTQWADNLERSSHALHFEGVSDTVIRTWLYYFGMCAAAFRAGDLGCAQWTLRKANTAAPKIVRRAPSQHDAH
ncbi:class I SAM-dependent methyltransferase [Nocardia sp. NPDC051321]|uniref:class I SAM-dependent methyltransferase n=1 Tax=Nocardia sp. NPDC051321 TaxID=3364323 RepID=UPI0037B1CEA8